ncbi:MAG: pyrimidine reductase family protein [Actinomycetota bacterium]|nr:pyrimidine reductase family protein [Actinomycetota bacterium]
MRRLLPLPGADDVDLDQAYWVSEVGRQHVRGVMVASADGAAQAQGRAGGLSGPADTAVFAVLRSHAEIILAGATTVRVEGYAGDQPSTDRRQWRRARGLSEAPAIAVVTRTCLLDPTSGLFTDTLTRPIVVTHESAPQRRVAALAEVADIIAVGDGDVDLAAALDVLAERGMRRVSCEGGPTLLSQVAAVGRLDELSLTLSPLLVGGPALRILDGPILDPAHRLRLALVLEDDDFLLLRYLSHRAV